MESRYLRLQLDAEVCARAEAVCARKGADLVDVLRALVSQIAQSDTIPDTLAASPRSLTAEEAPFSRYDNDLWSASRTLVDADLALSVLDQFIAQRAHQLLEAKANRSPDVSLIARLEAERKQALGARALLNPDDADGIAQILRAYGPQAG